MEGSLGSGGVLKKKSSSGCLIIKKKSENNNLGGLGSLNNSKEKKRPRLVVSESGSSDENQSLEFMRRKVNEKKFRNGSLEGRKSRLEGREYYRNNGGMESGGERKRNRLDLFEFDEYDDYEEFDGKKMRNEYVEDRFKMVGRSGGGNLKEVGSGSSSRSVMVDKRNHGSYFGSSICGKSKGVEYCGGRSKGFELEEDEGHMPISLLRLKYQGMADEPIRLQGKNGVLKVMVNKKKKMDLSSQVKNYEPQEVKVRKDSRSENVVEKDLLGPSFCSASKQHKKEGLFIDKEKRVEKEKMDLQLEKAKPFMRKGNKDRDSQVDELDTSLELTQPAMLAGSSKKLAKKKEERSPPPQKSTPSKEKEEKVKRGGITEKQMLREKIREMLVDAGWTIDHRPRRNRDYLDAVYINPSGTAYWSIIKAYDALKKQLEEDNGKSKSDVGSSLFAPLSENLINKLTRQTKKKIEKEMKRKRKEVRTEKSAKKSAVKEVAESSDSDQNEENLSSYRKQNCKSLKGKLHEVDEERGDDSSDDLPKRKPKKDRVEKPSNKTNSKAIQGRTSKIIGRCTLLVRSSNKGQNSESDGYVTYTGKRTVLAWLIDSGIAQSSEKVQYMNRRRTRIMLEGWITRDGIHCGCCSKILTVSKFELHAGSKLRQPFQNILLESGPSLLQCQINAWNRQEESVRQDFHIVDVDGDDPDDDTCGICGDGGDLICCDSCPSTFHQSCLEIQMLPPGDWHCPKCTCKFCGDVSGNVAEENDRTVDLIRCILCEKKYHKSCSELVHGVPVSSHGESHSFCGQKCQELYDHLQKIIGVKHEMEAGFSWSLIQRTDVESEHRGFSQRVECNSKLAVALSIMDECFLPIIDRRSGINIIRNVVYSCGSNFNRLDFHGFYTAILERGDELVSAASVRIHGNHLAEMPFIGTREIYRRQGMCRRLLSAIESTLCSLKVEKLIIPAISEHMSTWTVVFGFHQLEDAHKKEMKSLNMLVFPGTDMLQKQLMKPEISDGIEFVKSKENQPQLRVLVDKSDIDSTMEHNRQESDNAGVCDGIKINDKVDAMDSDSPASDIPSNDNTAASASDTTRKSDTSKVTTIIKSETEEKLKESSASLKCPSTSTASTDFPAMENPLLELPLKDNSESSVAAVMDDVCKISSKAPCLESILDPSGKSLKMAEEAAENENPVSASGICRTDECTMQSEPGSDDHNVVGIQRKVEAASEVSFEVEVARIQVDRSSTVEVSDDASAPEVNVKDGCIGTTPGSLFETAAQSTKEKVNGERSSANRFSAVDMESELHSSIELSSDSVAAADAKVTFVKGNIASLPFRDTNNRYDPAASRTEENVEVSGVETAFGSSLAISARAANENSNDNQDYVSVSTIQGSCESTTRLNPDLNQKAVHEVGSDLVALEEVQRKEVDPAETDKSSEKCKTNNPQEVDGKVACANSSCEAVPWNTASNENSA
ncbi:Acyl-CoA N-acyltransferase with RING/FYVE/PHD-type zinc finger protein [Forsythia ovata]|uniref:Acyl-CoA N-acyltransferase with RING/FYVE/PHD-type zinc finger protein n=1 Tax=Forsythia ovata TaxID=205694 RepID=A0ABD1UZL7_9LAMI